VHAVEVVVLPPSRHEYTAGLQRPRYLSCERAAVMSRRKARLGGAGSRAGPPSFG
jgi:hypothetical protein